MPEITTATGGWTTQAVQERMHRFATHRAGVGYAPLYGQLAKDLADDEYVLRVAACASPGQSPPDLLFAAVHFLLAGAPEHPLARYYATLTPEPLPPDAQAAGLFTAFVKAREDEMVQLVRERLVQANEPRRATYLLPALATAGAAVGAPLGLVEVGASAGLALVLDRYGYDYGPGAQFGDPASPVRLACALRGPVPPALAVSGMPDIGWRVGCDLNPLDTRDPDDRAWLAACVWADHPERAGRLATALDVAAAHGPLQVRRGDAREVLPELLAAVPAHLTACVFHTAVVAHFPEAARAEFAALVPALSRERPVMWVSAEPDAAPGEPRLRLTICRDGAVQQRRPLGNYHPHGEWLEWTDNAANHVSGAPSSR